MSNERETHHVQSFARGLAVIMAFDADHPELTLTDVAERTDLTRAAARRFLLTLTDLGYARRHGRHFSLTPSVLNLGYAYLSSQSLPDIAEPHLESLVADVKESSSVSVLEGDDVVYVARVATSHRIMTVRIHVGTRFPAVLTSMGRVMLADLGDDELAAYLGGTDIPVMTPKTVKDPGALLTQLRKIREQGYAIVDQELEEGLRAVAAPIHGSDGKVVAAINTSVQAGLTPLKEVRTRFLPRLLEAAAGIEEDLRLISGEQPVDS
jgi:IclR family pca regulon transcriptional regulator